MGSKVPYVLGKGTVVRVAMLPDGDDTEPVAIPNLAVAPEGAAAGETQLPLAAALPEGAKIPAGSFLNFKTTTGYEYMVQVAETAVAGEQELITEELPEDIAAGARGEYPLRLRYRSTADLDRTANRETAVDFDSDGYERGLTTSISQGMSCNGYWGALDAGYATAEYAWSKLRPLFVWLELPKPRDTYRQGRQYKGVVSVTSAPLQIPAGGIIQANLGLSFEGEPLIVPAK